MARGFKLDYDTDLEGNMTWVAEFLEDEWDPSSTVGQVAFRWREDAMLAGRKWLHKQINDINDLAKVDAPV